MKKIIRITILIMLFTMPGMLFRSSLRAQEWSAAQKEVWKAENDCWAAFAKGDQAGFLEFLSPDYLGWDDNSPMPNNKEDTQKWFAVFMQGGKILMYSIKPVGIKVYDNFAFADYYYALLMEKDGKKTPEEGRWTDILMKQNGKWVLIGDNGGEDKRKGD